MTSDEFDKDKLYYWQWVKKIVPVKTQNKPGNLVNIVKVKPNNVARDHGDVTRYKRNPVVLITGDGKSLPGDVKEFESWGIPHDLYCVNRSLLFFERQVDHWAAVDVEESVWFTQYCTDKVRKERNVVRHTIGSQTHAFDVYWEMDYDFKNDYQRRVLTGNTGYFATLTALYMGYEAIVLAGMPLNMEPHWYEQDTEVGPNWNGWCYTQWMDFKMKVPEANQVRSMGGYSAFILGKADKGWLNGITRPIIKTT